MCSFVERECELVLPHPFVCDGEIEVVLDGRLTLTRARPEDEERQRDGHGDRSRSPTARCGEVFGSSLRGASERGEFGGEALVERTREEDQDRDQRESMLGGGEEQKIRCDRTDGGGAHCERRAVQVSERENRSSASVVARRQRHPPNAAMSNMPRESPRVGSVRS